MEHFRFHCKPTKVSAKLESFGNLMNQASSFPLNFSWLKVLREFIKFLLVSDLVDYHVSELEEVARL